MKNVTTTLVGVVGTMAFLLVISFLLSWPVYMLWNGCLVGAVSAINTITWLQAWGINVLCTILFNSAIDKK
jgi:hypothetical protein